MITRGKRKRPEDKDWKPTREDAKKASSAFARCAVRIAAEGENVTTAEIARRNRNPAAESQPTTKEASTDSKFKALLEAAQVLEACDNPAAGKPNQPLTTEDPSTQSKLNALLEAATAGLVAEVYNVEFDQMNVEFDQMIANARAAEAEELRKAQSNQIKK